MFRSRFRWVLIAVLAAGGLLGAFPLPTPLPAVEAQGRGPVAVPDQYIVVFQNTVADPDGESARLEQKHGLRRQHVFRVAIKGFSATIPANRLPAVRSEPSVAYVEPDQVAGFGRHHQSSPPPPAPPPSPTQPTGVLRINADKSPYRSTVGSANVAIAIIDTGIELGRSALNVVGGVDYTGTGSYADNNGHGTHVAGTAAARDNGTVLLGVAPGAQLWAVKVLNSNGSGYYSWVIAGVDWVAQNAPTTNIKVANMSLGGGYSQALNDAVNNAVTTGVVFVVAAGNSSADASSFSPASAANAITVSAIADSDGKCGGLGAATSYGADDSFASFSNYGAIVALAAPGVDILSTYPPNTYATLSGTSMATPHVTGAVALYLAGHPGTSPAAVKAALVSGGIPQNYLSDPTTNHGGFTGGISSEPLVDAGGS